jgi:hypothetical protein
MLKYEYDTSPFRGAYSDKEYSGVYLKNVPNSTSPWVSYGRYLNLHFSKAEQSIMCDTEVVTPISYGYQMVFGDSTTDYDKIFILSKEEVEKYLPNQQDRIWWVLTGIGTQAKPWVTRTPMEITTEVPGTSSSSIKEGRRCFVDAAGNIVDSRDALSTSALNTSTDTRIAVWIDTEKFVRVN